MGGQRNREKELERVIVCPLCGMEHRDDWCSNACRFLFYAPGEQSSSFGDDVYENRCQTTTGSRNSDGTA